MRLGEADSRSDSFISLVSKLSCMENPPRMLFLENVVGFESSSSCKKLVDVLLSLSFHIDVRLSILIAICLQQYVLCPTQFGVPNQRPRFYLIAMRDGSGSLSPLSHELHSVVGPNRRSIGTVLESCPSADLVVSQEELSR